MLLTYNELKEMVDDGCIKGVPEGHINGASIDLVLGDTFWVEDRGGHLVDLSHKKAPAMQKHVGALVLEPGQFCLAQTAEVFHLPDDVAGHYMLKSSLARAGLQHLFAGWADPTWHSSVLTLEFKNELQHHSLLLTPGMKCGQMVLFRGSSPVPESKSYAVRGQYNHDRGATPSKGAR